MRSGPTLPSLASPQQSDAKASRTTAGHRRPERERVPDVVRTCLAALGSQLLRLKKQISDFDPMIMAWHRSNQTSKRLNCIPGVGPLLATALVASVADPKTFHRVATSRPGSGWFPTILQPRSGRLGSISKQGDCYLRSLFVAGALAVIRYAKIHGTKYGPGSQRC